ncbi:hypothetical protein GLOIN_2v1880501 [Rhizophagus clarus]|nr:hypothetical protein GLOIN_2v1880501 [Rhizophagus clarus]
MNDESENLMNKCGTMNEIHKIAEKNPRLKEDLIANLQALIDLISDVFNRQSFKDIPFETYTAASEMEIERFWETIQFVNESVTHEDRIAEQIKQRAHMQEFMEHCCKARHYFFSIKKCGEPTCTICHPLYCSPEDSEQLHFFPDPVPSEDLHYKSFEELYDMQITEDHRPSFKSAKAKKKDKMTTTKVKHSMPFCPSAVCVKNVGVVVNCVECEKPCLLFSAKKFSVKEREILQGFLDTIFYICSISFYNTRDLTIAAQKNQQDIPELPDDIEENIDKEDNCNEKEQHLDSENEEFDKNMEDSICDLFSKVFVNDSWTCVSQVEKLYYSAGIYPELCIECESLNVNEVADDEFSCCSSCGNNTAVSKKH